MSEVDPPSLPRVEGPDPLVARYEELRSQALGGTGRGQGLALFLRRGMKAWVEAFLQGQLSVPGNSLPQEAPPEMGLLLLHLEITLLLAGMALEARAR